MRVGWLVRRQNGGSVSPHRLVDDRAGESIKPSPVTVGPGRSTVTTWPDTPTERGHGERKYLNTQQDSFSLT